MSDIKPLIDPSFVQLCDETGIPTAEQVTISEANQKGLWHMGIHVLVADRKNKKILVQKRSPRMFTHPSMLELSLGGALKYGETYEQAALREIEEETGISENMDALLHISDYRYNHHFPTLGIHSKVIAKSFLLALEDEPSITLQDGEAAEAFFIPYTEAEELVMHGFHEKYGTLSPEHSYYVQLMNDARAYL